VRACKEAVLTLEEALATQDTMELREVGLKAVKSALKDTLCATAVHAAALDGDDLNTSRKPRLAGSYGCGGWTWSQSCVGGGRSGGESLDRRVV
jgi:hypothetical protein